MPIPQILKSKAFWGFSLGGGSFASSIGWDRYQAHFLHETFMSEAEKFGKETLLEGQAPRQIGLFCFKLDGEVDAKRAFREKAVKFLTAAGVDYKWILVTDRTTLTKEFNSIAQETNRPDLMLETGVLLDPQEIKERILKPLWVAARGRKVSEDSNSPLDSIWSAVRDKLSVPNWPKASEGYVALDRETFEMLKELADEEASIPASTADAPAVKSSFWSRKKPAGPSISQPERPFLCHLPVDEVVRGNFLERTKSFIWGRAEAEKQVGSAVLEFLQDQRTSAGSFDILK